MKRLIGFLLVVSACALPASHTILVASAEPATRHGGEDLLALAIIAAFVLVLIPAAAKPWK